MDSFLAKVILDNTVKNYLVVAIVILIAFILKRLISKYLAGVIYRLVAKTGNSFQKDAFTKLVIHPLEVFLLLLVSMIALDKLYFPTVFDFKIFRFTSRQIIECCSNTFLISVFIWLCLRIIDFVAIILEEKANKTTDQTDNQLILFFKDFFKVLIVINGVLLILHFAFNKNIGNLLTGLSIVGAAIALATRESLENLIASFIIFFDKPFTVGDTVKIQSITGTVERIGLRSTRIRTAEKTYLTVPNKQMVDSIVDNISLRTERKAEIKLELALTVSATKLEGLIVKIKKILSEDYFIAPTIFLTDIGKNANIITVEYSATMIESLSEFNTKREAVCFKIIKILEESNIELANSVKEALIKNG